MEKFDSTLNTLNLKDKLDNDTGVCLQIKYTFYQDKKAGEWGDENNTTDPNHIRQDFPSISQLQIN